MGYNETSGTFVANKYIDWMDVKQFRSRIRKANVEEIKKECKDIDDHKKLMLANIEECDKMLKELDDLANEEHALFMETKLTPVLAGLCGGIFSAIGLGLAKALLDISSNTASEIFQHAACAGTGILLGYFYYKARREKSNEARKRSAMREINRAKDEVNSKKAFYQTQIEVDDNKKEIAQDFIYKKTPHQNVATNLFEKKETETER